MAKGSGNSGVLWFTINLTDGSDNACLYCLHVCSAMYNALVRIVRRTIWDTIQSRQGLKGDMN